MERPELIELYKLLVEEEHITLDGHHKRTSFFAATIVTLFVATFVALRFVNLWYEFLALGVLLPILVVPSCLLGKQVSKQFYTRFLDVVTMRAKVEQTLGYTSKLDIKNSEQNYYWETEALVPSRHIESRNDFKDNSNNWIQKRLNAGYNKQFSSYFSGASIISVLFGGFIAYLGVYT